MRGKRAKAYRKLMHQYQVNFNFHQPYQVLLDHAILQDAARFKIDLVPRLEKMLQGTVKPMITQCDIRHLYNAQPKDDALIEEAKKYERRRCNHHELEEPLRTLECLSEVVDPKGSHTNKHRYIIASQDPKVRAHMRAIPGVPIIYISKSVVILEPMATATETAREREEKAKFKAGLKGRRGANAGEKRKREDEEADTEGRDNGIIVEQSTGDARPQKKRSKGPKGPNPLSVKKAKKRTDKPPEGNRKAAAKDSSTDRPRPADAADTSMPEGEESSKRRRRRRKHKPKGSGEVASHGGDAEIDSA